MSFLLFFRVRRTALHGACMGTDVGNVSNVVFSLVLFRRTALRCACTGTTVGNVSIVVVSLVLSSTDINAMPLHRNIFRICFKCHLFCCLGSTDCIALCMHGNNCRKCFKCRLLSCLGSTDCIALCMHGNNDPVAAALHIILGDTLRVRHILVTRYLPSFPWWQKNLLLKNRFYSLSK
jgi:hypothetical protein